MSKRFVYVLRNAEVPPRYYTGITSDVVRRHAEHIHGAEGIKRTFIQDGLRDALQALAAPGDVALALVPDGMVKADELALDFDNFGRAALESLESELTQAQRESLVAVDRVLDAMSRARHRDLWTEEAVRTHPKWQKCGKLRNALWRISVGTRAHRTRSDVHS